MSKNNTQNVIKNYNYSQNIVRFGALTMPELYFEYLTKKKCN